MESEIIRQRGKIYNKDGVKRAGWECDQDFRVTHGTGPGSLQLVREFKFVLWSAQVIHATEQGNDGIIV